MTLAKSSHFRIRSWNVIEKNNKFQYLHEWFSQKDFSRIISPISKENLNKNIYFDLTLKAKSKTHQKIYCLNVNFISFSTIFTRHSSSSYFFPKTIFKVSLIKKKVVDMGYEIYWVYWFVSRDCLRGKRIGKRGRFQAAVCLSTGMKLLLLLLLLFMTASLSLNISAGNYKSSLCLILKRILWFSQKFKLIKSRVYKKASHAEKYL